MTGISLNNYGYIYNRRNNGIIIRIIKTVESQLMI